MNLYTQAVDRETIRFRNTLDRLHRLMPDILETEKLAGALAHAGLKDRVTFIGMGQKFQIWEPDRFAAMRDERLRRAQAVRQANAGGAA